MFPIRSVLLQRCKIAGIWEGEACLRTKLVLWGQWDQKGEDTGVAHEQKGLWIVK